MEGKSGDMKLAVFATLWWGGVGIRLNSPHPSPDPRRPHLQIWLLLKRKNMRTDMASLFLFAYMQISKNVLKCTIDRSLYLWLSSRLLAEGIVQSSTWLWTFMPSTFLQFPLLESLYLSRFTSHLFLIQSQIFPFLTWLALCLRPNWPNCHNQNGLFIV